MNVEHENFFFGDLRVGPAAAQAVGHELRHGVGEVGVDHQRVGPVLARRRSARRRPAAVEQDLLHLLAERERHAQLARRRGPSPRVTAPQPPIGCQTPYSYSRNDRIENRLGQLNGDMPRYLRLERERQPHARVA